MCGHQGLLNTECVTHTHTHTHTHTRARAREVLHTLSRAEMTRREWGVTHSDRQASRHDAYCHTDPHTLTPHAHLRAHTTCTQHTHAPSHAPHAQTLTHTLTHAPHTHTHTRTLTQCMPVGPLRRQAEDEHAEASQHDAGQRQQVRLEPCASPQHQREPAGRDGHGQGGGDTGRVRFTGCTH